MPVPFIKNVSGFSQEQSLQFLLTGEIDDHQVKIEVASNAILEGSIHTSYSVPDTDIEYCVHDIPNILSACFGNHCKINAFFPAFNDSNNSNEEKPMMLSEPQLAEFYELRARPIISKLLNNKLISHGFAPIILPTGLGSDLEEGGEENDEDSDADMNTALDKQVYNLWVQFLLDVIMKSPNPASIMEALYVKLTEQQRL
ncbi:hypothetical protein K435DRAFT_863736 [Dendrothele bispora CBS 962.96]|uniref:Uncharacterized protein n=1 Tax=Dendrothele bispora (strain CBS 962.96) TaxID=1314807 RepID=A0A4S8LP58_DENBC|nr:hypothetical protein K435DRAFT_863736 [Dendrothele bispora CBS 962.96]